MTDSPKPGCWDHACPYRTDAKPRVGTNGGCHCDDCPACGGAYSRILKRCRHASWCPTLQQAES
jgi:hypothetical protein